MTSRGTRRSRSFRVDLNTIRSLPKDDEGPVFKEPWEAQAFAMTLKLHEAGHFTWSEWAQKLGAEIAAAQQRGDPDTGESYYLHWLAALEKLVAEKGLLTREALATRKDVWERAAQATPHGGADST